MAEPPLGANSTGQQLLHGGRRTVPRGHTPEAGGRPSSTGSSRAWHAAAGRQAQLPDVRKRQLLQATSRRRAALLRPGTETEFSRDQCDRLLKTRNTDTFKRGEQRNILKTICKILSKVWHLVEVTHFGLEFLHELRPFTSKKKKKYRLKQPSVEPCTGESSLKCHWYVQIIKSLTLQK